jgi:hypothetical protein
VTRFAAKAGAAAARAEPWLFGVLCAALALVVLLAGPVLTNDGPAHLALAQALTVAGDPAAPQLNLLYEPNPGLSPNLLGHLLLAGLLGVLPPLWAEQALQILCLLGILLAGRLALGAIAPEARWLALFLLPVALQRMFFLGLYNHALSIAGCLLCLWAWQRLVAAPGAWRAGLLALLALLTFAAQVSGWIAAVLALGTLAAAGALARLGAGAPARAVLRLPGLLALCLLPGMLLFLGFLLASPGGGGIAYGAAPAERLLRLVTADAFSVIGRTSRLVALLLTLALCALLVAGLPAARRAGPAGDATARRALPFLLLPPAFVALLLVIPEQAGGGWGHVWRSQAFPYLGLVLAVAALPPPPAGLRAAAVALAGLGGAALVGLVATVQAVHLPPVLRAFAAAEAVIGPHCSLAPVLGEVRLDRANSARLAWQPLLHLASRIELSGDRPVLYSYIARLDVYPARYRDTADPMRHLYGWPPGHRDLAVQDLRPAAYAASSGIAVDYVLLWDVPAEGGGFDAVRQALAEGFERVPVAADGRLELYRRAGSERCGPA